MRPIKDVVAALMLSLRRRYLEHFIDGPFDADASRELDQVIEEQEERRMTTVIAEDIDNLRHMLGVTQYVSQSRWGYRNYFAPGPDDMASMERLRAAGLVQRGVRYGDAHYYHATEAGCAEAGLSASQAVVACREKWG